LIGPTYLDKVLGQEFALGGEHPGDDPGGDDSEGMERASLSSGSDGTGLADAGVSEELKANPRALCSHLLEQRWCTGLFMLLTFYALFVPDLDLYFGNKDSRIVIGMLTLVICMVFLLEIVLRSLGGSYICRAYFWLDLISLASLLLDTHLEEMVLAQSSFVAGRSSRLARLARLFGLSSRSVRIARLQRLGRVVRVAALMPRLQRFFLQGVRDSDVERLLEKKLQRIFHFLDEDMDGYVMRSTVDRCLMRIRLLTNATTANNARTSRISSGSSPTLGSPPSMPILAPGRQDSDGRRRLGAGEWAHSDVDQVKLNVFCSLVLEDPEIAAGLRKACREQLRQANNMANVTARHYEYVGVRVALAALFLIFVMTLTAEDLTDSSVEYGFISIDRLVTLHFPDEKAGSRVPGLIQEQVRVWTQGERTWRSEQCRLLYLDLNRKTYCNDFVARARRCALVNSSDLVWSDRISLTEIDSGIKASVHRLGDMLPLRVPDFSDVDMSPEELERRTSSIAVLDVRSLVQHTARVSLLTTSAVIVIIVGGMWLLTRELSYLSRNLLTPLVELADDMESISRLQLAGMSTEEDPASKQGTPEIRLIRGTFENMKKAVKSWGKYVPWQVVQLLLRKGMEASIEVQDLEVSIFFSDIASFTSIVENLPPERSLLLLSRYFRDMSRIIDEHGGIVLEFIGDAIMCLYGAPAKNQGHPTSAVRAAVRMVDSLSDMNRWLAEKGLPEVSIRCGVHTGHALVGNMGFHSRMKYGIVGDEAEIPSRLEEMNKTYSTGLLISQATLSRLDPSEFVIRPIDYVHLGGRQQTGESQLIYQVLERRRQERRSEAKCSAVAVHTEAVECYRKLDFKQAADKFELANILMENITKQEDVPSALLLQRCKSYMERHPPPHWDGVWDRGTSQS